MFNYVMKIPWNSFDFYIWQLAPYSHFTLAFLSNQFQSKSDEHLAEMKI